MTRLGDALAELEARLGPEHGLQDTVGLDDAGIERLRAAVAPLLLPAQVEELYRWRNGTSQGVFAGWALYDLDQLLTWRTFWIEELQAPAAWLLLFSNSGLGLVTLDVPGQPPSDPSVWYGHSHDVVLERMTDDLTALVLTCLDAGAAVPGLGAQFEAEALNAQRLARSPGARDLAVAPPQGCLSRGPGQDWPLPWLSTLQTTPSRAPLTGATSTVAALTERARQGSAEATLAGRVSELACWELSWRATVDDGTGSLELLSEGPVALYPPVLAERFEVDVRLAAPGDQAEVLGLRPIG